MTEAPTYNFYKKLATIVNSGQSRSIILSGNIMDLFWNGTDYVPLIPFVSKKSEVTNCIQIIYEINGPIRISNEARMRDLWVEWKSGMPVNDFILKTVGQELERYRSGKPTDVDVYKNEFNKNMDQAMEMPAVALDFMKQMCMAARQCRKNGSKDFLFIIIEGADTILPMPKADVSFTETHVRRVNIVQDWFSDPAFVSSNDSVVLIAESRGSIHSRVSKLPQIIGLEIPAPDCACRKHFIEYFCLKNNSDNPWKGQIDLSVITAGLSIHALKQMLIGAIYSRIPLDPSIVTDKVEEYIQSQVGEDVVSFKRPTHKLVDVIGNRKLKKMLVEEVLPRLRSTDKEQAISAIIAAGALGSGKTYIWEAVAAELDCPVMEIKNIRSQWYGGTDIIFERLYRILYAIDKLIIELDEVDTVFGGVGQDVHETERRLTGKIQAMQSDPALKGKITWIEMTARIHRLSPDMKRPGRGGDLIVPILDPVGEDRDDFVNFALKPVINIGGDIIKEIDKLLPNDYSAASFSSLRSHLSVHKDSIKGVDDLKAAINELISPAIGKTRQYQKLQALLNCTRRSLLPDEFSGKNIEEVRESWMKEIAILEKEGVS